MRARLHQAAHGGPVAVPARTAAGHRAALARSLRRAPSSGGPGPLSATGALAVQRAAGNRALAALAGPSRLVQRSCSCSERCDCGREPTVSELALEERSGKDAGGGSAAPAPAPAAPPAIKKTINVYPISLGSARRNPYPDIKRANDVWSQCGVKVNALIGQCSTSTVLDTQDPKDVLNEYSDPASPTTEETAMLALRPGPSSALHAYYVPRMSAGSRGEAFWPAVSTTSAVVISDSAASDSLAHEIGHVLLDDGGHNELDPDDLMAAGRIRNVGVDKLNATQCTKATS